MVGGDVAILLMDKLLSAEATDDISVSESFDGPMLVVEEEELSVSSLVHGVLIEFV